MDYLPVVYSTPSAAAVADFVSTHYDLSNAIECKLLYRGWNDIFEVRTDDEARFIFRISKRRARGDADVASETAFLAYLDGRAFRSPPRFPRATVRFSPLRLFRKVGVPLSCSATRRDDRHRQEAVLATQEQTG